jgi:hypothetical protein
MEYIDDLYWFAENYVHEIEDSKGNGMHTKYVITQWTGLIDKNGMDIYEGDIVTGDSKGTLDIIVFGCGCFSLKYAIQQHEATYWGDEVEVKGNIFDNPKLLDEIPEERKLLGDYV